MSETTYIERYWRDAKPEDAIKEPPMVARFRDKNTTNWGTPCTLTGWDRGGDLLWSNGSCFWKYCQVYDAPDPGDGWRLIDTENEQPQDGDEIYEAEHKQWRRRSTPFVVGAKSFNRRRMESRKPDPGKGYRLLCKHPQERVCADDDWWEYDEQRWRSVFPKETTTQHADIYYRRRITPTVTYVPFTWSDREQLRGRWVARDNQELQLVNLDNSDGFYANGVDVENLCKYWKFLDTGKPVGKEVASAN